MIWFTSDLHIGHGMSGKGVIDFCNRPFRDLAHMEEEIILALKQNISKIETINSQQRDAIIHGLIDIHESFERIYINILPQLSKDPTSKDVIQDLLWDLREEFRHIDYHIHDSPFLEP